jgi:hypothetical protein
VPAARDWLPAGTGLVVYPSDPWSVTFTWESSIVGRTFSASLDGDVLDVDVSGSVLTVEFVAPAENGKYVLVVTETTSTDRTLFRFPVTVSTGHGNRSSSTDFTVTDGVASIDVNVVGGSTTAEITAAIDDLLEPGNGLGTYARDAGGIDYRDRSSLYRYGVVNVASTTDATSLLASSLTIPANTLTAFASGSPADASACSMVANGTVTNTTGSSRTITYIASITQSANTVTWTCVQTVPNGTSSAPWVLTVDWTFLDVSGFGAPSGAAWVVGNGLATAAAAAAPGFSDFDPTAAWTVTLTATPSFNSASLSVASTRGLDLSFRRALYTA